MFVDCCIGVICLIVFFGLFALWFDYCVMFGFCDVFCLCVWFTLFSCFAFIVHLGLMWTVDWCVCFELVACGLDVGFVCLFSLMFSVCYL